MCGFYNSKRQLEEIRNDLKEKCQVNSKFEREIDDAIAEIKVACDTSFNRGIEKLTSQCDECQKDLLTTSKVISDIQHSAKEYTSKLNSIDQMVSYSLKIDYFCSTYISL